MNDFLTVTLSQPHYEEDGEPVPRAEVVRAALAEIAIASMLDRNLKGAWLRLDSGELIDLQSAIFDPVRDGETIPMN